MSTLKRCKVVMLPTKEKAQLTLSPLKTKLRFNDEYKLQDDIYQHLYIISDDEIKEGDWYITDNNRILQCKEVLMDIVYGKGDYGRNKSGIKGKIITTTGSSLIITIYEKGSWRNLPQPSQSFIEKYVESYNKGQQIVDVMVEYITHNRSGFEDPSVNRLKINPKDNTITIKRVKDSWSREEVENLVFTALYAGYSNGSLESSDFKERIVNSWISKNL